MRATVKNRKNEITIKYENILCINCFKEFFQITFEDYSTATFHFTDETDGSEWDLGCC